MYDIKKLKFVATNIRHNGYRGGCKDRHALLRRTAFALLDGYPKLSPKELSEILDADLGICEAIYIDYHNPLSDQKENEE